MNKIRSLSVLDLKKLLAHREISSREICETYLDRIVALDGDIGAYLTVTRERALSAADEFDRKTGCDSSLGGIPYAAKDNLCTAGVPTTCASNMLRDFIPPHSATVIEKLSASPLLGKTNMDEFGMGSTCESSAFQITKNPCDTSRTPGGSSGGSAAAVAAGMAPFALGSDTGGSVRLPAAFCGVVGLTPTYGAISRYGLVEFASSLDRVGILTLTVADCALVFSEISGYDKRDRTSVHRDRSTPAIDTAHLRIGVLPDEYIARCSREVRTAYEKTLTFLATNSCNTVELSFPSFEYALSTYYVISSAEASSNLARYDGIRYGQAYAGEVHNLRDYYIQTRTAGFGDEVKKRILLGTYALSAEGESFYARACAARELVRRDLLGATQSCDVILTPTAPTVAPRLHEMHGGEMYAGDVFTVPASLAGLPAMSVPADNVLPVGIQLIAAPHREDILFSVGALIEGGNK